MMAVNTGIIAGPLQPDHCYAADLHKQDHGCIVSFVGVVRNEHNGKGVTHLIYDCYRGMAEKVLAELAQEVVNSYGPDIAVTAWHGTGYMNIGDASVALHVAAGHRPAAYDGSRQLIERLKENLPVWKQEFYTDNSYAWLEGS